MDDMIPICTLYMLDGGCLALCPEITGETESGVVITLDAVRKAVSTRADLEALVGERYEVALAFEAALDDMMADALDVALAKRKS